MKREWLEKFYSECGRETTLAYNVLNHSNNWGVTLITGIVAAVIIGSINIENNILSFSYPNFYLWIFVIIGWIIMLRFFARSALGLINLYRWNELSKAVASVLSLSEKNPLYPIFERNCIRTIDAYYFQWRSPVKIGKLLLRNMKLMYTWPFVFIFALIVWGVISLERSTYFYMGLGIFFIATIIEIWWLYNWYGLKYKAIEIENLPNITDVWLQDIHAKPDCKNKILVLGFCSQGPYHRAQGLLDNDDLNWIPWHYNIQSISQDVLNCLAKGRFQSNQKVVFASWPEGFEGEVTILRTGHIDHFSFNGKSLTISVLLDDLEEKFISRIDVNESDILCFFDKVHC
jgi:hypothetical protein